MHRFLISAAHKSSGKTAVSIGLAAALRGRGLSVQPFKKGPDYIDPLWLSLGAGRTCRNLDFYLSSHEEIESQFRRHGAGVDVTFVEGNKGLYDGLDLEGSNSNAALAKMLRLPVVLVIDTRGMTRGIAPLLLGYQAFDAGVHFAGVILNRVGGQRHESKLRTAVERYTPLPVLGALYEDSRLTLVERHLGLMPANEVRAAERHIADMAQAVAEQVDIDRLLALTAAGPLPVAPARPSVAGDRLRVAIARDAAFGFYYADDLDALVAAGGELVFFDTLRDAHLPACDALFIGGGFPESFLDELEANATLRGEILQAIESGLPTYAECGGLMYLARSIEWQGRRRQMVGALPGNVRMHDKPVGRGYVIVEPTRDHPWFAASPPDPQPPKELRAHEFHYSSMEGVPATARYAWRVRRGHGIDGQFDGLMHRHVLASYTHLRTTSAFDWPAAFLAYARHVRAIAVTETHAPCSR